MRRGRPKLTALWSALDEATFGPDRTLNLRESLPSAAEARLRTDNWLKAKQVAKAEEVLIITGRGNNSVGGIGVVRQAILQMMPALRKKGVVESWREHSPGSVVVTLAPMSALFSAANRRRGGAVHETTHEDSSLSGLSAQAISELRQLAMYNLDAIGVDHGEQFLRAEMIRTFSRLMSAIPDAQRSEESLRASIKAAIEEAGENGKRNL